MLTENFCNFAGWLNPPFEDLSRMMGNYQVRFLGDKGGVIRLRYPTKIYKEFDREIPFSWYLLNHDYRNQYANEIKMSEMFTLFSVVAMVIALIGLLGMVAYLLEQQRRVIGIRKVLGATTHDVVGLNLRQYLTWVVAGNLVAILPVWWVMNTWLNNFAYRITFPWDTAVYAFAITLLTTLAIIAFQTYQAASANPVEAIKYE